MNSWVMLGSTGCQALVARALHYLGSEDQHVEQEGLQLNGVAYENLLAGQEARCFSLGDIVKDGREALPAVLTLCIVQVCMQLSTDPNKTSSCPSAASSNRVCIASMLCLAVSR